MTDQVKDAVRAQPARAALTVGAVETEYLRFGSGHPVVVLDPALAARVDAGAVPARWQGHRLIVPTRTTIDVLAMPPAERGDAPFDAWMRGLIDGLGLSAITVVVAPRLTAEVRRFAARYPGEIVGILESDAGVAD